MAKTPEQEEPKPRVAKLVELGRMAADRRKQERAQTALKASPLGKALTELEANLGKAMEPPTS